MRLRIVQNWAWLLLVLAPVPLSVIPAAAQDIGLPGSLPQEIGKKLSDHIPEKPTLPPAFSIPVRPLGYSAPGLFYLGRHNSLASLDFIDENRLLFTFQVPGLMQREGENAVGSDERQVRAVVVTLPEGKVEAEASWTLHDRARYLWMLKDGHFLLRDGNGIQEGDASLQLKPSLHFPGRLLWLELTPAQKFMTVNYVTPQPKVAQADDPPLARTGITGPGQKPDSKPDPPELKPDLIVRTLNRDTGEVVTESKMGLAVPQSTSSDGYTEVEAGMFSGLLQHAQMSINAEGFIEAPGADTNSWILNLKSFDGKARFLDRVNSACRPTSEFVSEHEFLMTACDVFSGWDVVAISTAGNRMWGYQLTKHEIWPQLVNSLDGSRIARETVVVEHPVTDGRPHTIDSKNFNGQIVRVFNAANGKIALETTASPIFDGGGNVAISPSGRRVAVLNNGQIEVFDLPAAPPAPNSRSRK
ncbi:MAG: hypothetical protein WB608_24345 [Terracidiphilus sp.]